LWVKKGKSLWDTFTACMHREAWLNRISIASAVLEWGSYGFLLFQYAKALKSLNQQEQACPTKDISFKN
jgi:hypothetical protein